MSLVCRSSFSRTLGGISLFVICTLFSGCDREQKVAGGPTTNIAPPEKSIPFNPEWTKLPPNFVDHAFRRSLQSKPNPGETLVIAAKSGYDHYFQKSQSVVVKVQLFELGGLPRLTFENGFEHIGSWVGENAFGARREVSVRKDNEIWIEVANFAELRAFERSKSMLGDLVLLNVFLPDVPDPAVDNLRYLVIFELLSPPSDSGPIDSQQATFVDPVEVKLGILSLKAVVRDIWFFDEPTGIVYQKIRITSPSTWRSEMGKKAESGHGDLAYWLSENSPSPVEKLKWARIGASFGNQDCIALLDVNHPSVSLVREFNQEDLAEKGDANAAWWLFQKKSYLVPEEKLGGWLFLARTNAQARWKIDELASRHHFRPAEYAIGEGAIWNSYLKHLRADAAEKAAVPKQEPLKKEDPEKEERVVKWLMDRAAAGSDYALFELGVRLLEGRGVERNHAKALEYLEQASKKGNSKAKAKLQEVNHN